MKIILWNTEWASPDSKWERLIREIVRSETPDVVCITEGYLSTWNDQGAVISSEADYGYRQIPGRRKVILWSKAGWSAIDPTGNDEMPPGRFVSGVTQGFRFVGVCVPWKDAHVSTGRKDLSTWQDHLAYLGGLEKAITPDPKTPTILLGDFNQRTPRLYSPADVYEQFVGTVSKDFWIGTAGVLKPISEPSIDHICFNPKPT